MKEKENLKEKENNIKLTHFNVWDRFTLDSSNKIICNKSSLEKEFYKVEQLHQKNDKALMEYLYIHLLLF